MIPTGTDAQQVQPRHRLDVPALGYVMVATIEEAHVLQDERDYAAHVCPGQHCIGRRRPMTAHRHTDYPVHTLTPEQATAATEYSGRTR